MNPSSGEKPQNVKEAPMNRLVAVLSFLVAVSPVGNSPLSRYPILTETGGLLPSLFAEIPASAEYKQFAAPPRGRNDRCSESQDLISVSRLWEKITMTVHASLCTEGSCGSHYMYSDSQWCGSDCAGGYFNWYISQPEISPYCDGWRYTGNNVCNGCRCEEDSCNSCP